MRVSGKTTAIIKRFSLVEEHRKIYFVIWSQAQVKAMKALCEEHLPPAIIPRITIIATQESIEEEPKLQGLGDAAIFVDHFYVESRIARVCASIQSLTMEVASLSHAN